VSIFLACLLAGGGVTIGAVPQVFVVSPAPSLTSSLVTPFVEVVPLHGKMRPGQVVWVAAECVRLSDEEANELLGFAQAGAVVVVEDAPRLARGSLASALGMTLGETESSSGLASAKRVDEHHPAAVGVPFAAWRLPLPTGVLKVNDASVIVAAENGWPVVWVRRVGNGKVVGIAAQRSQWASGAQAIGYDGMMALLLAAAARAGADWLAQISARTSFRAWMYLGLAAGQAAHTLRVAVPDEYDRTREQALEAWRIAGTKPAEAVRLSSIAARGSERLAEWAADYWRKVPLEPLRKTGARRELLLCPGTLDFVHCMNLSSGAGVAGAGRPAAGGEMWAAELADNPPGPATGYWRGLRPLLVLTAELPLSVNLDLQQKRPDGSVIWRPCWLDPAVQNLLSESVPPVRGDTFVFYSCGQPWLTASCDPDADYSAAAIKAFGQAAAQAGLSADASQNPPTAWEPSAAWRVWQQIRAQQAVVRWKTLAAAIKKYSPSSLLAVDAGYLCDPLYAGLGPETGAEHVDCLAPTILANYETGFDAADLVAEVRLLASIADGNGDGIADRWPGCVARFRWGDALAISPAAHELISAVALAAGAQGIMQTVAESAGLDDAVTTVPEEVYLRWEASFAPALRGHDLWLDACPQSDAIVWQSFLSACMARPTDKAERAAAVRSNRWASIIARLGYVPRYVFDAQVENGDLTKAALLIVPSVLCVSDKSAAAIGAFAQSGGTVLLGPGSLSFDEYHRPLKTKPSFLAGVSLSVRTAEAQAVAMDEAGALRATLASPGTGITRSLREGEKVVAWTWPVGDGTIVYLSQDRASKAILAWLEELLGAGEPSNRKRSSPRVVCSGGARGILTRLSDGRYLCLVYNAGGIGRQNALSKVDVAISLAGGLWQVQELRCAGPLRRGALQPVPVSADVSADSVSISTSLAPDQYRLFLLTRA
jgi:hypothetical protein